MDFSSFLSEITNYKISCSQNEPMKGHTTFKIGGNADCYAEPNNVDELRQVLRAAKRYDLPFLILGKGSNILVSDRGIEGVVISLLKMDNISVEGKQIIAESGANLSSICIEAEKRGLTGLEFAFGIPGSVGGALFMNAGAYGGEMAQVVKGAYCLNDSLEEIYLEKEEMELSYRHSVFQNGMVITKVIFELGKGEKSEISDKMQELLQKRKSKQPLEYPSAGSTFKRPKDNFAGTLIEKNGLKGEMCGGAMVSKKHAGFIINYNNATAEDVKKLIKKVQDTVERNDGIKLEPEVIVLGR